MPIGGSATELNITGAKLKVTGGVDVTGSIAYTTDATGFGSVTVQIDNDNTLNITSGKNTGVAKIERATAAAITTLTHTNVNNNTTIHIALKNTATAKGVFITLGTFASDDTVKVNYTDEYSIGPGETAMVTIRKVNGVASVFVREMFTDKATSFDNTDNKPFYIKDGANYKYPLYNHTATGLTSIVINGTTYHRPSAGITTKTRPPKGLPDNTPVPSGTLKIGNNVNLSTVNYDVYGTSGAEAGSLYRGSTQKARFGLDLTNNEASGSFTDSGVSSGDTYTLYLDKTATTSTDTATSSQTGGWTGTLAFHHGAFSSSDYSSAYSTIGAAATAGFVYSDTSTSTTYTWGTLSTISTTDLKTTYTWESPNSMTDVQIVLVAGGGGGGGSYEAGGGGGGGYKSLTGQNISRGNNTIVVGNGGVGAAGYTVNGLNGENSSFGSISTLGGGRGGNSGIAGADGAPTIGGSGGGGTHVHLDGASGTSGQGNAGGTGITVTTNWAGGGGGGAGSVGGNASSSAAGTGGTGVTNNLLGSSIEFSAGGNGGRRPQNSNGADGTDHTGKGGGGGGRENGTSNGGSGGSGIVIIKSTNASMGKDIAKVTGISFTSSNIVFTVQQDSGSGTSITHVKYTINGGSEVTTAVGTLSVAHSLSASAAISVVAWAVDTSGNQLGVKKTVTGTVPS